MTFSLITGTVKQGPTKSGGGAGNQTLVQMLCEPASTSLAPLAVVRHSEAEKHSFYPINLSPCFGTKIGEFLIPTFTVLQFRRERELNSRILLTQAPV